MEVVVENMLLNTILILFLPLSTSIRVLSSGRIQATHKPHYSGATLLHSSMAGQDTVTICARFNTYQFVHKGYGPYPDQGLVDLAEGSFFFYSGAMTEENPYYKARAGRHWQNGDVLLFQYGSPLQRVDWRPGVWSTACLSQSISRELNNIWFDGNIIKKDDRIVDFKEALGKNNNIVIMAFKLKGHYSHSMFGAMTDINIWNRSLSQSEVEQWAQCELGSGGNLLDWTTAQWEAVGLQEVEMDKDEVCRNGGKEKQFLVFHQKKAFDASLKLCRALGGEMATAKDLRALKPIESECGRKFFSAITDRKEEGVWMNAITGEREDMSTIKWLVGQPNYDSEAGEDCVVLDLHYKDSSFFECNDDVGCSDDVECSQEFCPVCKVPVETNAFHL